jgi:predicted nucleotide-binding protein (sugar kinase/HSP70/actin superfamily)
MSDEEISELGKNHSHSECCYPNILAHGHAAFLAGHMRKGLDKLLLVNAITSGEEKYPFCPYVQSAGHVILGNLRGLDVSKEDSLLPIFRFYSEHYPIDKEVHKDLKRVFGRRFSRKQVKQAVEEAEKEQQDFIKGIHEKGEKILGSLKKKGKKVFVGVGRGYTLFDDKASSSVHELFSSNGLHFIPAYMINEDEHDVDFYVDNMFWFQGRSMISQTLRTLDDNNLFPVRLTNFNCGPDSVNYYHEQDLANAADKPNLILETDGHNSNAQFGTRIKAHDRVTEKYFERGESHFPAKRVRGKQSFFDRIIGVPYMSDTVDILAATFKASGLNAKVMPTRTPESIEIAKKILSTNSCRPLSFVVGDQIAWLESLKDSGEDPNAMAATFLPRARGPCRFGQYSVLLRRFFDERGYEGVPIMSPDSTKDYTDVELPSNHIRSMTMLLFRGMLANELLKNDLFRIRPYERDKGETDFVYDVAHKELTMLIKRKASLGSIKRFLQRKAEDFEGIDYDREKRFPRVLMGGEIFVRGHEECNENSIRRLEANGLEVILVPNLNWIDYVNSLVTRRSWETKDFVQLGKSVLKRAYMDHVQRKLSKPFKKQLQGREIHDPMHVIKAVEKEHVFDSAVQGEAAICVGEAYSFINGDSDIDGIYHVGPLGCMQETAATSRIQPLIQEKRMNSKGKERIIPFMEAVFGESESPNLDSEIAIFAENCRLRRHL